MSYVLENQNRSRFHDGVNYVVLLKIKSSPDMFCDQKKCEMKYSAALQGNFQDNDPELSNHSLLIG